MNPRRRPVPSAESVPSFTPSPTAIQLAWAAGFIDGEGCIHIAKQPFPGRRNCSYRLGVHITQNHLPVLERFCEAVGLKAPIHTLKHVAGRNRTCYTLNYSGRFARQLIERLLPFLVRKRDEALAALEFCVQGQLGHRPGPAGLDPALVAVRERYYVLLRQLK